MPKEKPILFSTEMVRAILNGEKTMMRQPIKPQPKGSFSWELEKTSGAERVPPYKPGDILMPREVARLFLRVTAVRVERLQDIPVEDIWAEGLQNPCEGCHDRCYKHEGDQVTMSDQCYKDAFARLWNGTIKPKDQALHGWAANPWVWVTEFEKVN